MRKMPLIDVVAQLDRLPSNHTIYAVLENDQWTESSLAVVTKPPNGKTRQTFFNQEMTYVLGVNLAIEILEDWQEYSHHKDLDNEEKFHVIVHYAKYDALPIIRN